MIGGGGFKGLELATVFELLLLLHRASSSEMEFQPTSTLIIFGMEKCFACVC